MIQLAVLPCDPIVARDGRPFGEYPNNRMRSSEWIYPSVLAGTLRTMVGKMLGRDGHWFDEGIVQRLLRIAVAGPFPVVRTEAGSQLLLPRPRDMVVSVEAQHTLHARRPRKMKEGTGCNMPRENLLPVFANTTEKPVRMPDFWPMSAVERWAAEDFVDQEPVWTDWLDVRIRESCDEFPQRETRVHVGIDRKTGAAQDSLLYMTTALDLRDHELTVRVSVEDGLDIENVLRTADLLHPFGGERRLSRFRADPSPDWSVPERVRTSLAGVKGLRMMMASPALFEHGWLPGWLDQESLQGAPPGAPGLVLRLRAACVERWKPISGWDMRAGGQKPVRRLVPSGSVYFFEVIDGDPAAYVSDLWLHAVSDAPQDRRDGFGLATFGVWNPAFM